MRPPMEPRSAETTIPLRSLLVLLGLVAGLLLLRLGTVPLLGPDEPRYSRVAIEMARAGEWVRPTLQGEPWLEKPALFYWLAGIGFRVLGETETAARLPSVLAALALVLTTALFGARLYGRAAGLHAGFVLGTCVLTFAYGRAAAMDMLLAAGTSAGTALVGLSLLGAGGPLTLTAAGACIGLAVLAKGPLGLLLPGLVVVAWLAITRDLAALRRLLSIRALAALVVVAGPWYLFVYLDQGWHFVEVFLLNHNVQRFTSTIHRHPGPFYYYVPVLLVGLFPWSGLTLPALAELRPRRAREDLFVLMWLAAPLVFFSSAASKLPGYILPCLPPLAILAGRAAAGLAADAARWSRWGRATAVIGLVLAAVVACGPVILGQQGERAWVSLLPAALWPLVGAFAFSRRVARDPAGALHMLRVVAAGFLLLLALALPPILAARESGRRLFIPANGREVLVWEAWRTAWMSGYFYNDARVREVSGLGEIAEAAEEGALVLCGPGERRQLEAASGLTTRVLVEGPRENVLLSVRAGRPEAVQVD